MRDILMWSQIGISVLLMLSVLFQDSKNAPQTVYGGNTNFKPKGKEAFFNNLTKITGTLLFINAFALILVK